jgi:hypothetical protein
MHIRALSLTYLHYWSVCPCQIICQLDLLLPTTVLAAVNYMQRTSFLCLHNNERTSSICHAARVDAKGPPPSYKASRAALGALYLCHTQKTRAKHTATSTHKFGCIFSQNKLPCRIGKRWKTTELRRQALHLEELEESWQVKNRNLSCPNWLAVSTG